MRTIVRISIAALLVLGGCNNASKLSFDETPAQLRSIAELKSRCVGSSFSITETIAIQGVVTANDHFGEFPKTIIIEDASGGITVATEHTSLFEEYPIGVVVSLRCNGLILRDYGGKIEVAYRTSSPTGIGRIPRNELKSYLRVEKPIPRRRVPTPLTLEQVAMCHVDTYVEIAEVYFLEPNLAWCDKDPATGRFVTTERIIRDSRGQEFSIRTAGTSKYAEEPTPKGMGSLCGIIDYFNGEFTLCITNSEVEFNTSNAEASPRACP